MVINPKKLSLPIALLIVLSIWASFFLIPKPIHIELPSAYGYLSLADRDMGNTVYIVAADSWDSYPEQFYTPADFKNEAVTVQPSKLTETDYRRCHFVTHRLRLTLPDDGIYSVTMRSCDYSMRIFINGKEVDSVGVPGTSRETTEPQTLEKVYTFDTTDGEVEFVVHAANFVHKDGCKPPYHFTLGTPGNIIRKVTVENVQSALFTGCLLATGLYYLALFLFNRERRASLVFFVCCALMMIMSNRLMPLLFPDYNWFIAFKLEYITLALLLGSLVFLVDVLFSGVLHKIISHAYYCICGLYALIILFTDSYFFTELLIYFHIVSLFMIVYVPTRLAMSIKKGKQQNLLAFIGMTLVCLFGTYDILRTQNIINFGYIAGQFQTVPIGMVALVFCYALAISLEISEYEKAAALSLSRIDEAERRYHTLLEQSGEKKPTVHLSDFGLTQRELDVAWLLIDGKTRKDISELLIISAGTVNSHCSKIYAKTNCAGVPDLLRLLGTQNMGQKNESG